MSKKILSAFLALVMVVGLLPLSMISAFAAADYSTGKGDTATYYANVPDNVSSGLPSTYSAYGGSKSNVSRALVEIDGETFVSYYNVTGNAYDLVRPIMLTHSSGIVDTTAVDINKINYLAFRIKATTKTSPVSFSISISNDGGAGWLNAANALFIDKNTGKAVDTVEARYNGYYNITFPVGGFDGYMIVDLNTNFISGYTQSSVTSSHKEYLLTKHSNSRIQYYFHNGTCHGDKVSTDWSSGAAINMGDILMVEDLEQFKGIRLGCDNGKHTSVISEIITEPDCDNKGVAKVFCKYCKTDLGTEEIPEKHNYESTRIDPTETEQGYTLHTCTLCGDSYKDNFVKAGLVKGELLMGMYHFPDHPSTDMTDAEYLEMVEAVFKAGYVNCVTTNGGRCFRDMLALYKKYNIKFFMFTGLYNSKTSSISKYIEQVELKVKVIREEGAWDLFLGFHWDEPTQNGQTGDDFLAMTKALYEKWGKRNYPVFAVAAFLEEYYVGDGMEQKTELYEPRHMQYVTDAGWDIYHIDLRKEADNDPQQQAQLNHWTGKYGEYFENGRDFFRFVHRRLTERIGHDFSSWFYPATKYGGVSTGEVADEGFMIGQIEGFNEIMMEQPFPGGQMLYTFTTWGNQTALEERLPITDDEGNYIMFPEQEKYNELSEYIIQKTEEYENTEVYLPDGVPAGALDVSEITATTLKVEEIYNYEFSIDGQNWIRSGVYENLTPETEYTIISRKISTGETKEFTVTTESANPYATGLKDTASYYCNVPDDIEDGILGYGSWNENLKCSLIEINGESFISYHTITGNAYHVVYPTRLTYSDGYIDQTKVNTANVNYWVWRIKATPNTTALSFSISIGTDGAVGWLDATKGSFIDAKTGEVSDAVVATSGGYRNITFNEEFDGWMVIDLSQNFISGYSKGSTTTSQKDYLLNYHDGKLQYYVHDNCHGSGDLDWSEGTAISIGDMLMVENINTFKSARFGCDKFGHVYEEYECIFCGERDPEAPPVHNTDSEHTWVESGREEGTCSIPEIIHYTCICGATKTMFGALGDHDWKQSSIEKGNCTTPDIIYYACDCGATKQEEGSLDLDAHVFEGGLCIYCKAPYGISYATGKNDTATYYANVPDDTATGLPGYSQWSGSCANMSRALVSINGETFVSYHSLAGDANDCAWPTKLTYTTDGMIDKKAVNIAAQEYLVWRIRADVNTTPIAFTISIGNDYSIGRLNGSVATFIDINTREVSTSVVANAGGHNIIKFTEDFDGYMIVNLDNDFIAAYTKGGTTTSHKDYLLNYHNGKIQYYVHKGCHGASDCTDWSEGAAINIGDILMVEDIETFKAVRLSCDELGHVYENGACKFCGEADPDAPAIVTKAELKVDSQTSDTISVSWNDVTGVNDYYIQITDKLTGSLVRVVRAQNTNATTIYGLTAGTEYLLSICAYTPGKPAVYEEAINAKTSGFAPLGLTATEKGAEVELNWNKPANAVAYYCYILKDGQTIRAAGVQNPEQTTFTFMLPKEAGSYTFGIIAATFDGVKNVYWDMQTTTQPIVVAVNNPTLSVVSKTTDSLTLGWNAIGGVNDYYIQIVDKETGALVRVARAQNTTSTTIYGLSAGTDYLLSICAYTPGRPAVYSEPIEAQTESHSELNLTATQKGNEVELNWNKPANAIAYYVYILKDGETIRAAGVQNPEQTTFTFMMPIGKGSYTFGIIAATNNGAQNIYSPMQVTPDAIVVA